MRPGAPERRPRRGLQSAVLASPVLILATLAWTHRGMFADGFIYLHVVQNILAGHGPVFNSGQRVEVFTSPLWISLLALVGFVTPFPLEWIAVVLGIALTVTGVSVAIAGSRKLVRQAAPGRFLLPLGALVFVAVAPVWSLASMGLETGLTFFWLAGCLWIIVRWAGCSGHIAPAALMVLGLGPLVRPELGLYSLVFVVMVLVVDRSTTSWPQRVRRIGWALLVPFTYQVLRMGYYGMLVANTATAKEAALPRPGKGISYLADFIGPYWFFVPAAGLLLGAYLPLAAVLGRSQRDTRRLWALLSLPTAGVANAAYVTVVGGDYVHARLLLPAFFAMCAPVAVVPVGRKYLVSLLVVPWALVCMLSLRSFDGSPWSMSGLSYLTGHGQVEPSSLPWDSTGAGPPSSTGRAIYVQFADPATVQRLTAATARSVRAPTIATPWIGAESFQAGTGIDFLDVLGLSDPLTAHLLLTRRGYPGHEKPLPTSWVSALLTADGSSTNQIDQLQVAGSVYSSPLVPVSSGNSLRVQTAWARAALSCPQIHDLEYGVSQPLSPRRFLSNIYHSVTMTKLRIPPDPETAYHRFCGSGTPESVKRVEVVG